MFKEKRGIMTSQLLNAIIVIITIALVVGGVILALKVKGVNAIDFFKNLLRFPFRF